MTLLSVLLDKKKMFEAIDLTLSLTVLFSLLKHLNKMAMNI